jgi:hypothetical protein
MGFNPPSGGQGGNRHSPVNFAFLRDCNSNLSMKTFKTEKVFTFLRSEIANSWITGKE